MTRVSSESEHGQGKSDELRAVLDHPAKRSSVALDKDVTALSFVGLPSRLLCRRRS